MAPPRHFPETLKVHPATANRDAFSSSKIQVDTGTGKEDYSPSYPHMKIYERPSASFENFYLCCYSL